MDKSRRYEQNGRIIKHRVVVKVARNMSKVPV